jgi:hypothetical protein
MLNLGPTNTVKTITYMYAMAKDYTSDMYMRNLAKRLRGCNQTETIKNIFNFCMDSIDYAPQTLQIIESPKYILSKGVSNCVNYSILIRTLCNILGIKCLFATVSYNKNIESEHVYTIVYVENRSIIIDCVYNKIYKLRVLNKTEINEQNFQLFDYVSE